MGKNKEFLDDLYEKLREIEIALKESEENVQKLKGQREVIKNAISVFGGFIENTGNKETSVNNNSYPLNSTIKNKILFSLKNLKEGTTSEIADYMALNEGKNKDDFFNNVTMIASDMFRKNLIKAERRGKKNVYYLY